MLETKHSINQSILPEFSFYPSAVEKYPLKQLPLLSDLSLRDINVIKRYRRDPFFGDRFDLDQFDPARILHLDRATDEQLHQVAGLGRLGIARVRRSIKRFRNQHFTDLPSLPLDEDTVEV